MKHLHLIIAVLLLSGLVSCKNKHGLFQQVDAGHSGISFNNRIVETDSLNPLDVVNIYNGGGVGIGDFNNDGLPDIYFTGNRVSSKLYLNKGNLRFEDITEKAGAGGLGRWARGVAIVDINNDGLMDIYICNTIYKDSARRTNILYVNQGMDKSGIPHFKDMAREYGLDIHTQSTMANFFDYDNDGDLDMYLTVNEASSENQNRFGKDNPGARSQNNKGRLYQNNWDQSLGHPVFQDVSAAAGITLSGFGHGATIADINRDGWKDIYVSNDFLSDNILYVNNRNGTFTDRSKEYFKHTSYNAMGQDIIDINNDGLSDVVELDMNPKDNYRKKMMLGANNYSTYQNFDNFGHQHQYVRNTLQLNQGPALLENDSVTAPVFSEVGFMSGIAQTDWSWTPLVQDFDNDGYRDLIVTNGFPRDVSDHDFIAYRHATVGAESHLQLLDKIPMVKLSNYAFKNTDGMLFNDVTSDWGLTARGFSNGAAYADLDNDGDIDIIINNIDDEASLYENTTRKKADSNHHFLQVRCKGGKYNVNGIGTWIDVYYQGHHQAYENTPYRGYLSTDQNIAHFGLGTATLLDSVVIRWQNGRKQLLQKVSADQLLIVDEAAALVPDSWHSPVLPTEPLFKEITRSSGITYTYRDPDMIDFDIQSTLPHKLSAYGPALATADVDGNGLDDIVVAGNAFSPPTLLMQQVDGQFIQKKFLAQEDEIRKNSKDEGLLLFDADGDGDPDLYVASGGYQYDHNSPSYQDKLYLNDGKGNFTKAPDALPPNYTSKLCVRAIDFNNDGKTDLFVSGRVDPWNYPKPVSSFIFRNDSEGGHVKFTDVTADVAPGLQLVGMVCDALFTDFDNDGLKDLVIAGEWMPLQFFKNINGKFSNVSAGSGINDKAGWWNSITAGDFRHTGRIDYIVGNVGLNTLYHASDEYPVYITANDFDKNGGYEPIPSLYLPDQDGRLKEFPAFGRDDIVERLPTLKKRYDNYEKFANATMDDIFPPGKRNGAVRLKATILQSCFIRNDGGGKFTMIPLPEAAQVSALNGMVTDDFDGDGNLDVLINGNDFGTEVSIGRYDALNGLLLKGNGNGGFEPLTILQSGIYLPGDGKALVKLKSKDNNLLVAASEFKGDLKLFSLRKKPVIADVKDNEVAALITFKNGKTEKREFYFGSSFLSQSARFITIGPQVATVKIFDNKGQSRLLTY